MHSNVIARALGLGALVLLSMANGACEDGVTPPLINGGIPASARITPATASLNAIGDTALFQVEVLDSADAVLDTIEGPFTWASLEPGVAEIVSDGRARSVATGTARIVVSYDIYADTALLTVQQIAGGIAVTPPAASLLVDGTIQLAATSADSNGVPIPGAAVGVTWSSRNNAVATVSGTGLVTGEGLGSTQIVASSDAGTDSTQIVVSQFNEPVGYAAIVGRPFNTLASAGGDRGTGSYPFKTGGSEGWDDVEVTNASTIQLQVDATAPLSPPSIVGMEYTAGTTAAGNTYSPGIIQTLSFDGPTAVSYQRLYVRSAFKLSPTYEVHPSGNKVFFFRSSTGSGGASKFEPIIGLRGNPIQLLVNPQGTLNSDRIFEANTPEASATDANNMQRDKWYIVETQLEMNDFGTANGVLRMWLNGVLIMDYGDVEYLPVDQGYIWDTIHVNPTWGGQAGTRNTTFYLLFDDFYVSGAP